MKGRKFRRRIRKEETNKRNRVKIIIRKEHLPGKVNGRFCCVYVFDPLYNIQCP